MTRWLFPVAMVAALATMLLLWNRPTVAPSAASALPLEVESPGSGLSSDPPTELVEPEGSNSPVSARSEAAGETTDTFDDRELNFDPAALARPNVIVFDENTNLPLADAICEVVDSNGISLIAETDEKGRLVTDEALLTGPVSLAVLDLSQRRRLSKLDRPGRTRTYVIDRPQVSRGLVFRKEGLRHTGDPDAPDRWSMAETRWVPIECAGVPLPSDDFMLVLCHAGDPERFFSVSPSAPNRKGLDEELLHVSEDARPFVFEAPPTFHAGASPPSIDGYPWSRQRVDDPVAGRVLRAVHFQELDVLVASADANVVPHLHELPLRLEFAPLVEQDADVIREQYGTTVGQRIIDLLYLDDPASGPSGILAGAVTSDSGQYHQQVRVSAVAVAPAYDGVIHLTPHWVEVDWRQDESSAWVGSFHFPRLPSVAHRLEFRTSTDHPVTPPLREATPPHEFERGAFVVRDLVQYVPVVLRLRQPDGSAAGDYFAQMTSHHVGLGTMVGRKAPDPAPEFVLSETFPRGFPFEVLVQSKGHVDLTLTQDDFRFDGGRLVGETTLTASLNPQNSR
ncbi:hypothetical protein [Planctomycetes bacterium Poly30]